MDKDKRVSLISRESDDITLDFKLLKDELESRGIEVEVLTKLLRKKISPAMIGYLGHMAKQRKAMKNSDVIVLDTYCIPVSKYPHGDDLKVIQMWHALSAVKQFGWQTVGKKDGTSEKVAKAMKMHEGYDYVLSSSDVTSKYFAEAFRVDKNKIKKIGLPRIDYILKENPEIVKEIKTKYRELDGDKKTILYAPTFHKGKATDVEGLADEIDSKKYNLIVKLHPLDSDTPKTINREGVILDYHFNSYDLLRVSDIVISDYSSFVVEASLVEKPLYLYTFDQKEYEETTGLNMNFQEESIGKYVFQNAEELAAEIGNKYDFNALKEFRDKYIDIDTKDCTKQLADFIESLL